MLNIPASIEALIKRDTTRKNFRVQFPNNSARSDLTNADIVQETVRFTESICSQDSFRFGLAECSVIEFETVGVPDMRGELIRCSCEIDTSDLSAAQLQEIASGSYDGTLVLAADSDIGFGYFRIPYGDFVVNECPRNHELISHRQVTAYSAGYDFALPEITAAALSHHIPYAGVTCRLDIESLALACMAQAGDEAILQAGRTRNVLTPTMDTGTNPTAIKPITIENNLGQTLKFWVSSFTSAKFENYAETLFSLQLDIDGLYTALAGLDAWLASKNPVGAATSYHPITGQAQTTVIRSIQDLRDLIESRGQKGTGTNLTAHFHTALPYYVVQSIVPGGSGALEYNLYDTIDSFIPYVRPDFYDASGSSIVEDYQFFPIVPVAATFEVENLTTGEVDSFSFLPAADYSDYIKSYSYSASSSSPFYQKELSFSANGDVPGKSNFDGAFSASKILNDYLELCAQFAAPSRFGGLRYIQLGDSSPAAIAPADYSAFWWDEYSADVGTIRFTINVDGQDTAVSYVFGPSEGVYDMTSNEILRNTKYTQNQALALLDDYLVPALQAVKLSSIELSAEGRPDLEPGDALQITDKAAQSFGVYLMRRELSGIQVLHDEITAVDGSAAGQGGQTYNSGNGQGVTPTDDWVVEFGKTGDWTWRKWRSGLAECWASIGHTLTLNTRWAEPIYYNSGGAVKDNLPSGLFHSVECCTYAVSSVSSSGADCWPCVASGSPLSTTQTCGIYLLRINSSTASRTFSVSWHVKGRWKA